ncbi:MAG: EVE domain-containing protein [Syntrophomonas sp.]|nr:EVE domain-containing protein [Syntrophomonas sp.]
MSGWLLKTEPDEYSWADLIQESEAVWDGIKAAPAPLRT